MAAIGAPVPAHVHFQHGRPPAERLVSEPTHHGVTRHALLAAAVTAVVRLHNPASDHRPCCFDQLPDRNQAQLIKTAESGQVRRREGSVRHVEVFPMGWCENLHPPKTSTPYPGNDAPTTITPRLHPRL